MSIFPRSGVRGIESLIWLKYYNVQKTANYIHFRAVMNLLPITFNVIIDNYQFL